MNETNELRWQENIESSFAKAFELAQDSSAEAKRPIDPDFVAEWVEGVKNVSNEKIQDIWARLLVQAPTEEEGRIPTAVVNFLKQLDPHMARLLKQIYQEGAVTDWKMPVSRTKMDFISEEVGLATVKEYNRVAMLDGLVSITTFNDGDTFELVQLSARARRIGEIVYGDIDAVGKAQGFFEDFPQWLSDLMERTSCEQCT